MEFWQKLVKHNANDKLQTPDDVYKLPVEYETREFQDYLMGCYYDHIEECRFGTYFDLVDLGETQERVITKVHMHFTRDFRRYWQLASVWFVDYDGTEKPFMVIRNAGREGDDFADRIITDVETLLIAEHYLVSVQNSLMNRKEHPESYNSTATTNILSAIDTLEENWEKGFRRMTFFCPRNEVFKKDPYPSNFFGEDAHSIGRFNGQEYEESVKNKKEGYNPYS